MRFSLAIDDFHRLSCQFEDGDICTTAESSEVGAGLEALSEALDALETEGFRECFPGSRGDLSRRSPRLGRPRVRNTRYRGSCD